MKYLLITAVIFLFSSCKSEQYIEYYGGYSMGSHSPVDNYIVIDKGEAIFHSKEHMKSKCPCIKFFENKQTLVDSSYISRGGRLIQTFIDDVSFNKVFILVDQKPIDSLCECNYEYIRATYKNWRKRPNDKYCKEALERSTFHQYWIINQVKDNLYGPLTKKEYLLRRRELGIPSGLKLKFEKTQNDFQ